MSDSLRAAALAAARVNALLYAKGKLKLPETQKVIHHHHTILDRPIDNLITREYDINDVPAPARNLLTRGFVQDEICKYSGASISTRGRYLSYDEKMNLNTKDRPLYLHIQSTSKESVNLAMVRIQEMIGQFDKSFKPDLSFSPPPSPVSTFSSGGHFVQDKVFVGLESNYPAFCVRDKILGPAGSYLQHIKSESGAQVTLRGRGSGYIEPTSGREAFEPMYIYLTHPKPEGLQTARTLAINLIDTVHTEYALFQQQSQAADFLAFQGHVPVVQTVISNALTSDVTPGVYTSSPNYGYQPTFVNNISEMPPISMHMTSSLPPNTTVSLPMTMNSMPPTVSLPMTMNSMPPAVSLPMAMNSMPQNSINETMSRNSVPGDTHPMNSVASSMPAPIGRPESTMVPMQMNPEVSMASTIGHPVSSAPMQMNSEASQATNSMASVGSHPESTVASMQMNPEVSMATGLAPVTSHSESTMASMQMNPEVSMAPVVSHPDSTMASMQMNPEVSMATNSMAPVVSHPESTMASMQMNPEVSMASAVGHPVSSMQMNPEVSMASIGHSISSMPPMQMNPEVSMSSIGHSISSMPPMQINQEVSMSSIVHSISSMPPMQMNPEVSMSSIGHSISSMPPMQINPEVSMASIAHPGMTMAPMQMNPEVSMAMNSMVPVNPVTSLPLTTMPPQPVSLVTSMVHPVSSVSLVSGGVTTVPMNSMLSEQINAYTHPATSMSVNSMPVSTPLNTGSYMQVGSIMPQYVGASVAYEPSWTQSVESPMEPVMGTPYGTYSQPSMYMMPPPSNIYRGDLQMQGYRSGNPGLQGAVPTTYTHLYAKQQQQQQQQQYVPGGSMYLQQGQKRRFREEGPDSDYQDQYRLRWPERRDGRADSRREERFGNRTHPLQDTSYRNGRHGPAGTGT